MCECLSIFYLFIKEVIIENLNGWVRSGVNYYGGQIYRHPDGFKAIERFNYYYESVGFEVSVEDPYEHIGNVDSANELP